jgi:hypothetical protein
MAWFWIKICMHHFFLYFSLAKSNFGQILAKCNFVSSVINLCFDESWKFGIISTANSVLGILCHLYWFRWYLISMQNKFILPQCMGIYTVSPWEDDKLISYDCSENVRKKRQLLSFFYKGCYSYLHFWIYC